MKIHTAPQGTPEWLEARRGVITGSKCKDARDYKQPTAADKKMGATRGEPSSKLLAYAYDLARERNGGMPPPVFVNDYMRKGTEEEPAARRAFETRTGLLVLEAGFITTDDDRFGVSVDGFIGDDGIIEIKTMVSSATLFNAYVDGTTDDYIDQCNMAMWLTGRKFVKLVLWAPDLPQPLRIIDIERKDDVINAMEADLLQFKARVDKATKDLAEAMAKAAS